MGKIACRILRTVCKRQQEVEKRITDDHGGYLYRSEGHENHDEFLFRINHRRSDSDCANCSGSPDERTGLSKVYDVEYERTYKYSRHIERQEFLASESRRGNASKEVKSIHIGKNMAEVRVKKSVSHNLKKRICAPLVGVKREIVIRRRSRRRHKKVHQQIDSNKLPHQTSARRVFVAVVLLHVLSVVKSH